VRELTIGGDRPHGRLRDPPADLELTHQQIPFGTVIEATNGTVNVTTANPNGTTETRWNRPSAHQRFDRQGQWS
jgi:hypothetical protein